MKREFDLYPFYWQASKKSRIPMFPFCAPARVYAGDLLQHRGDIVRVLGGCFRMGLPMGNVTIEVPLFLRHLAEDLQSLDVKGGTVGECLENFLRQFPSGRKFLFDEKGKFFGHIDIYVNGVSTFPEELARPVQEGDRISMLYLIDGG